MPGMPPEELIAKIQAAANPEEGLRVLEEAGYELAEGSGDMMEGGEESAGMVEIEVSKVGPEAMKKMRDKALDKAFPPKTDDEEEVEE